MTASALLAEATRLGIGLSTRGDRLHVQAPAGVVTPEFRDDLIKHKPALLALLKDPSAGRSFVVESPAGYTVIFPTRGPDRREEVAPPPAPNSAPDPEPEPGWVQWARDLPLDRWDCWRQLADQCLATMPPGGKPGERLERSLELAYHQIIREERNL